jgi:hypothetical protein
MKAGRFAFATILTFLAQAAVAADSAWITDANGCKIWDERPTPNETVTWSGACVDGFAGGEGVLQWIVNGKPGSRHEGSFVGGKANGKGTTYQMGGTVEGNFVDGRPLGHVVRVWPDGARYEGDYAAEGRTGKGVLTRANGDRYEGDFVDGKWSGHGTLTNTDGARYEGGWLDNKRSGQGSQLYADGATYSGEWREDKPTNPEATKTKLYALSTSVTGSNIGYHNTGNLQVPANKTYAQLTPEEKLVVKESYEKMAKDDEPPYPLHGAEGIFRASEALQHKLLVRGELDLAVTIDSHGTATLVEVFKSPDAELTKAMASVLMLEKYKPAICKGSPCQMKFPFRVVYRVTL